MSSLLERRESATSRNQAAGSRLLPAGGIAFAAVLADWLAYGCTHPAAYTVDPADLRVYDSGGLIVRHVSPPYYLEYHWRGLQNLSGNAFVLVGAGLLVLLTAVAVRSRTRRASGARRA